MSTIKDPEKKNKKKNSIYIIYIYIQCIYIYPPTPAAQGGARKGKGFSDTTTTTTSRAVSDDTLGSFWSLFPGSSVRQCHGVFPSGTYVFAAASGRSS